MELWQAHKIHIILSPGLKIMCNFTQEYINPFLKSYNGTHSNEIHADPPYFVILTTYPLIEADVTVKTILFKFSSLTNELKKFFNHKPVKSMANHSRFNWLLIICPPE
jgi:hypothetical protein